MERSSTGQENNLSSCETWVRIPYALPITYKGKYMRRIIQRKEDDLQVTDTQSYHITFPCVSIFIYCLVLLFLIAGFIIIYKG